MPHGNTKFQSSWTSAIDCNGQTVREWCRRGNSDKFAYCRVCDSEFRIDNAGKAQILQHAKGKVHKSLVSSTLDKSQSKLSFASKEENPIPSTSAASISNNIQLYVHSDEVLKSEGIWAAQVANANFSFRSCDQIQETFAAMFPDSKIAADIKLSRTKVSYLLADGMGPYFRKELINDLCSSGGKFSLHFDETTQAQVKKQMDIRLRYWSSQNDEVWCRYYRSLFFGHAEAEKVSNSMMNIFQEDKIPISELTALGMDGPNVNKAVMSKLESLIKGKVLDHSGLIDIGSCNMHIVHNSFGKGIEEYGNVVEHLCLDLFYLFKHSAARREDYKSLQIDLDIEANRFQRHTEVRWLSLGPSVDRLLEQWDAISAFVKQLEKSEKSVPKSINFKRIQLALTGHSNETLVEALFIASVYPLFKSFLLLFQTEAPLIHLLHDRMKDLLLKIMNRFIKPELLEGKTGKELLDIDVSDVKNCLSDQDIVISDKVRHHMKKLSPDQRTKQMLGIRAFYRRAVEHLQKRLPLGNVLIMSLGCLNPLKKTATDSESVKCIQQITRQLEPTVDVVLVTDEWKCYQQDSSLPVATEDQRVDHYWREVFALKGDDGKAKYKLLEKVIKTALVLPHGNADVERSLSVNINVVTDDRNQLSEQAINGIRMVKDAVAFFDPQYKKPQNIPFTKELIKSMKTAHASYQARLEEERNKKEQELSKARKKKEDKDRLKRKQEEEMAARKKIEQREQELSDKEKNVKTDIDAGNALLKEGKIKLEAVMKEKEINRSSLQVAQMMIDTGTSKSEKAFKELEKIRQSQRELEKEKTSILTKATSIGEKDESKSMHAKHNTKHHDHASSSKRKDKETKEEKSAKRKQSEKVGNDEASSKKQKH